MCDTPRIYSTTGRLEYLKDYAVVWINGDLARYYRALIPKYYQVQGTRYNPHITVVRLDLEKPDKTNWGQFDGERIVVRYDAFIRNSGVYWWIDCYAPRIGEIRKTLGLAEFRDGYRRYHLTIGNNKS